MTITKWDFEFVSVTYALVLKEAHSQKKRNGFGWLSFQYMTANYYKYNKDSSPKPLPNTLYAILAFTHMLWCQRNSKAYKKNM